jgi:hypothetical protein
MSRKDKMLSKIDWKNKKYNIFQLLWFKYFGCGGDCDYEPTTEDNKYVYITRVCKNCGIVQKFKMKKSVYY